MALQLVPALDRLKAALTAAGFRPTIDPAELDPQSGGVLLEPRELRDLTLAGGGTVVVWVYLVVPNVEPARALELLDDALEGIAPVADFSAHEDPPVDLAAAVRIPSTQTVLPAYRVAIDLDLEP